MKQTKVNELSSLARSKSDIEDLTADERKFYDKQLFYEHKGRHLGVICNPSDQDKAILKEIAKKIRIAITFVQEPADDGNITRHKLLST